METLEQLVTRSKVVRRRVRADARHDFSVCCARAESRDALRRFPRFSPSRKEEFWLREREKEGRWVGEEGVESAVVRMDRSASSSVACVR